MRRIGLGVVGVVLVGGCKPACELVCTEVPLEQQGWDQREVGPEIAVGTLRAADPFEAVVAAGDWDGDGLGDVAVLAGGAVHVVSGATLAGGGQVGVHQAVAVLGSGASGLAAVGDLDGDGLAELAAGNGSAWQVFSGGSGEMFATVNASGGGTLVSMAGGGDVNGDGRPDVVVSQFFEDSPRSREEVSRLTLEGGAVNAGSGSLGFGAVTDLERPHTLAILGDVDGDGLDDVAAGAARNFAAIHLAAEWGAGPLGGLSNREVHVHECYPNPDGCTSQVRVAAAGDVDGDGVPDLVVNGVAPASAWVVPGTNLGSQLYKTSLLGGTLVVRREVTGADRLVPVGDVDGAETADGRPLTDLLAISGDTAWLFQGNQLTGTDSVDVADAVHVFEGFAPGGELTALGAGDLDGDGLDDLLLGNDTVLHVLLSPEVDGEVEYVEACDYVEEPCRE